MIDIDCRVEMDYSKERIDRVSKATGVRDFELIFVDSKEMLDINSRFRGVDRTTDVLSFPLENPDIVGSCGSIIIDVELALAIATEFGHALEDEIDILLVHGLLHLKGYDHEGDDGEMYEAEKSVLDSVGIDIGLIGRGEAQ